MTEWRWLSTEVRPVPEPVATPLVWAVASLAGAVLVAVVNLLGEGTSPVLCLVLLCTLAATVSWRARVMAAPGTAALCWFFLNGFAVPPAGELSWRTCLDTGRISCLLTMALLGTSLARLVSARAAYHRVGPPEHRGQHRPPRR